jgi:hypothetical protein
MSGLAEFYRGAAALEVIVIGMSPEDQYANV